MHKIIIYTTENCSYCKNAKAFLNDNNLAYEEVSIKNNPEAAAYVKETTEQTSVPVIFIDDTDIVVGFDEVKLKELLHV